MPNLTLSSSGKYFYKKEIEKLNAVISNLSYIFNSDTTEILLHVTGKRNGASYIKAAKITGRAPESFYKFLEIYCTDLIATRNALQYKLDCLLEEKKEGPPLAGK